MCARRIRIGNPHVDLDIVIEIASAERMSSIPVGKSGKKLGSRFRWISNSQHRHQKNPQRSGVCLYATRCVLQTACTNASPNAVML